MEGTKLKITKRTGEVLDFDPRRISNAILKAVRANEEELTKEQVEEITQEITEEIGKRFVDFYPNVENIQDIVEKHLVKRGHYELAKSYILFRAKRQKAREEERKHNIEKAKLGKLTAKKRDGTLVLFDINKVKRGIERCCKGYDGVSIELIAKEVLKNVYDGITTKDIEKALVLASVSFIEQDPGYSNVSARLFLQRLYKEVIGTSLADDALGMGYRDAFIKGIRKAVDAGLMDKRLLDYDLNRLSQGLKLERDELFEFIGIRTLYGRYFMRIEEQTLELPQSFWMRVAMGIALNEPQEQRTEKALEFYELLSSLRFIHSTPTLFHAGGSHPQLSSCYLTTVEDDLSHIFKCIGDNAQLSKWSGGLGNDWTNIRATGAIIKSTQAESQGVVPFLKIANDVTVAISRTGKRRGGTCAYLETWHLDIEDFLDLRKNTGDERRRAHDMNTANWIPDLFMKRVFADEEWTLFSPEEVPDLHDIYGRKFEKQYEHYEEMARNGKINKHKVVSAKKMWRKMLSMLFETGHPWITFKDPCNIRSPQDHAGVVHSSNLCTEITLNTSRDETAVCNLGSVNLEKHVVDGKLDKELLAKSVKLAIRMLDNVIDLNFYPTIEAKNSNMRHRPIGLGVMGFQDALFKLNISFEAESALTFSDNIQEFISYYAILGSSELAKEKGTYSSYEGSKWDRGILPHDTLDLLEEERGEKIEVSRSCSMDWTPVREHVRQFGMRNSNTMAIAPTATISNVAGCFPCIEPIYKNIYVKSNISGEFTVVNKYLIWDLKQLGLWNQDMLDQLKYYDGNLSMISSIPEELKAKYKEAFEIDPLWLLKISAVRGKWIDQSQSHNVFFKGLSGKMLDDIYKHAWKLGLKTTYYLRSMGATQIEKSTLDASKYGFTQKREYNTVGENADARGKEKPELVATTQLSNGGTTKLCLLADPECEACQ